MIVGVPLAEEPVQRARGGRSEGVLRVAVGVGHVDEEVEGRRVEEATVSLLVEWTRDRSERHVGNTLSLSSAAWFSSLRYATLLSASHAVSVTFHRSSADGRASEATAARHAATARVPAPRWGPPRPLASLPPMPPPVRMWLARSGRARRRRPWRARPAPAAVAGRDARP